MAFLLSFLKYLIKSHRLFKFWSAEHTAQPVKKIDKTKNQRSSYKQDKQLNNVKSNRLNRKILLSKKKLEANEMI